MPHSVYVLWSDTNEGILVQIEFQHLLCELGQLYVNVLMLHSQHICHHSCMCRINTPIVSHGCRCNRSFFITILVIINSKRWILMVRIVLYNLQVGPEKLHVVWCTVILQPFAVIKWSEWRCMKLCIFFWTILGVLEKGHHGAINTAWDMQSKP